MTMPVGHSVIDLMLNVPGPDNSGWYDFMQPMLMDEESKKMLMPAQYMFKDIPNAGAQDDYIAHTIALMDQFNISIAMQGIDDSDEVAKEAYRAYPDRFINSYEANPNNGMDEVRKIRRLKQEFDIKAVTGFPSGLCPQVPVNDKKWYPIYAVLIDLDIPFCPCMGVPGPRLPMGPQKVELIDEVCWFFPELKVVMRHGCEPWTELAWKLMLKYPNLYYMTSAFTPKYYPKDIVHYANTRGSDKIMYAGYYPMGISLERIFKEMPDVPFKDEVWPKFLSENAKAVFKL
jgi:predicted TIM-barrel fold metal-dependent hydrolase